MWPALKAHHPTLTTGGLLPQRILFSKDPLGRGLPLLGIGMAMGVKEFFAGRRLRRGILTNSSWESMLCELQPPRSQLRRTSGWLNQYGY